MKTIGVIPARLKSTRLSDKILRLLDGRPMIEHVWQRAKQAKGLDELIIACDDGRVEECAKGFGAKAMMTSPDHPNGTSRIAEVAGQVEADVFINIQGDEPLIDPSVIDQLASVFDNQSEVVVATLATRLSDPKVHQDPNVVKVVCDQKGDALYFSRAAIPFCRDQEGEQESFLKHLGIYGYQKSFLLDFVKWPSSKLEQTEKLEQLRILENGYNIRVLETDHDSIGVDTEEDLLKVQDQMSKQSSS